MNRRDFIKKSFFAAAAAGYAVDVFGNITSPNNPELFAGSSADLVAVKGGEPDVMFDRGIKEFGGLKNFIKKGQTVVVKPNIGWDVPPERAANTNPKLVRRIIEHCYNAGAKQVYVFDNTCDNWTRCYSNSGIERAVKDAGGKIVSGAQESYYQKVTLPKAKKLKHTQIHELIMDSDVFINVPVLKHHAAGRLTISMKNMMGVVWDRGYWHQQDLHQCIADFAAYKKPTLNIVDAYNVMTKHGPRGVSKGDLVTMKSLIISTDMVAADAASAKLYGIEPKDVNYIEMAADAKAGRMDLNKLNIKRIKI